MKFLGAVLVQQSPLRRSIQIHLLALVIWSLPLVCSYFANLYFGTRSEVVAIEVFQTPTLVKPLASLDLEKPAPKPQPVEEKNQRAIFGVSRAALTSDATEAAPEIKSGNTLAKENDQLRLNEEDPASLPIPADEFLVTQMPRIKKEIRADYPAQAKQESIEGPVMMEILIDKIGKVRQVRVLQGPGHGLNEAAKAALESFEFIPAKIKDEIVAVKIKYTYRFVLENR